jgi:hypothetical protein
MANARCRTICWTPIWNKDCEGVGVGHVLLAEHVADSVVLALTGKLSDGSSAI